jgi:hypothetical protein
VPTRGVAGTVGRRLLGFRALRPKLELRCQLIERGRKNRIPIEDKDVISLGR